MPIETQLLCTFCEKDNKDDMIDKIRNTYTLVFDSIYVLENQDDPDQIILTYNINPKNYTNTNALPSTISVHRKKHTNTIYTINAINLLIKEKNNGILDKSFAIDWNELTNTVLVTAYGNLKKINTKILEIVELKK
jgi:hypothetical protein